jgi:stalled ribosome alternative rescue factor ArfA
MKIEPLNASDRSSWSRSSFTDGKQIKTAKSPMDWTVKAMFDDMLAREKQTIKTKRLGAYERKPNYGV